MKSFFTLFKSNIRIFFRDKMLVFFTLLFPLILGVIFGGVFGTQGGYSIKVGVLSKDKTLEQALSKKKEVEIVKFNKKEDMQNEVAEGKLSIAMVTEEQTLKVYLNKVSVLSDPYLRNLPDEIAEKLSSTKELKTFGIAVKETSVRSGKVQTTGNSFFIPGLLAVSLFSSGVFSAIELFSRYREKKILKRLQVTSLSSYSFILSSFLGRLIVSILSAVILYFTLTAMFQAKFIIHWPLLSASVILGSMLMLAFGAFISLISPNTTTATNLATAAMTIMFFFAGVYFPLEFLPGYLQVFGKMMPLYHLAVTFRMALGVEKVVNSYIITEFSLIVLAFTMFSLILSRLIFKKE
jgi:ABC-2 type transport system permease protein